MFRTPNPSTDAILDNFIELYHGAKDKDVFNLEDAAQVAVGRRLMASKGYTGEQARARSHTDDQSRDSMLMQYKMYGEVYRHFGWFRAASDDVRTQYRISPLGELAANSRQPFRLMEECAFSICFPNNAIDVKFSNKGHPYINIFRFAIELGGVISRDELIGGPLCLENENNQKEFEEIIGVFKGIRESKTSPSKRLAKLRDYVASVAKRESLQINTMSNYSRIPIALMRMCGWFENTRVNDIYSGRSISFKITPYGYKKIDQYLKLRSVDYEEFSNLTRDLKKAVAFVGLVDLLERADYEIKEADWYEKYIEKREYLTKRGYIKQNQGILFSPYQLLSNEELREVEIPISDDDVADKTEAKIVGVDDANVALFTEIRALDQTTEKEIKPKPLSKISEDIQQAYASTANIEAAIDKVFGEYSNSDRRLFYPAVADLFTIIGISCEEPRHGQNAARWDAMGEYDGNSIPSEIKSPREEMQISVKAIRQALENKVIALAGRAPLETKLDYTSFAVGYEMPNDRAEVHTIVSDIKTTYGIRVGVLDFKTLLTMAASVLLEGKEIDVSNLVKSEGIILSV